MKMTSERSKRRAFLWLILISKSIYKKLLLTLFYLLFAHNDSFVGQVVYGSPPAREESVPMRVTHSYVQVARGN